MRLIKLDPAKRTRSAAEIFRGHVDTLPVVTAEQSPHLRLSEIHFRDGARNRWHVHSTDQILIVTEGEGTLATDEGERDLAPGVVAHIPANTRHWHGAKPGSELTHWSILGAAETRIVD